MTPILTITGSDSTGGAGIQADIRTINALGGYAVTAITSITVQDSSGIMNIHNLPVGLVIAQTKAIIEDVHPKAIKIGMVRDTVTIKELSREITGIKHIVLAPGMFSSNGKRLMTDDAIDAWKNHLIPKANLLQLRTNEAEAFLDMQIATDEDMIRAAQEFCDMGAEYVLLRGGHHTEGVLTALLYKKGVGYAATNDDSICRFFSSHNTSGWQKHGVGGALSTAIATCLALDDDMETAIQHAHAYMHSQVVYSVSTDSANRRPADIYNQMLSLIASNYTKAHDVAFYADQLAITTRYLSQVTNKVVNKPPKQIIDEHLVNEATILLKTTRLTIQEISDKLGFSSQVTFSKFFSQRVGCTPSEWRNKSYI